MRCISHVSDQREKPAGYCIRAAVLNQKIQAEIILYT